MKKLLLGILLCGLMLAVALGACADMKVTFFNVGQADSTLLEIDDKIMLIDTGSPASIDKLLSALDEKNITKIDILVASFPGIEHIGGMVEILDNFEVEQVWMPRYNPNTELYGEVMTALEARNLKAVSPLPGGMYTLGGALLLPLSPIEDYYDNLEDYSIAFQVVYKNNSILFLGDINGPIEEFLVENYGEDLSSDVLKVSQHGSNQATSPMLLQAVGPSFAVISSGREGFPSPEAISRIEAHHGVVLRTDRVDDIIMESNGDIISVVSSLAPRDDVESYDYEVPEPIIDNPDGEDNRDTPQGGQEAQTQEPTNEPINEPTNEPVNVPTNDPTNESTDEPTHEPTNEPANQPTDGPAQEATDVPDQQVPQDGQGDEDEEGLPPEVPPLIYGKITQPQTNFRAEPSTRARRLDILVKDTVVQVLGTEDDSKGVLWYKIMVDDETGYVRGDLLEVIDE